MSIKTKYSGSHEGHFWIENKKEIDFLFEKDDDNDYQYKRCSIFHQIFH